MKWILGISDLEFGLVQKRENALHSDELGSGFFHVTGKLMVQFISGFV